MKDPIIKDSLKLIYRLLIALTIGVSAGKLAEILSIYLNVRAEFLIMATLFVPLFLTIREFRKPDPSEAVFIMKSMECLRASINLLNEIRKERPDLMPEIDIVSREEKIKKLEEKLFKMFKIK